MRYMLFFFLIFNVANCQDLSNYKQLFTDVFSSHQKEVLPRPNFNTPLEITLTYYFMTLTQFQELEETLIVLGGVAISWNDAGISWTPATYGGATYTTVAKSLIWTPPITLLNAADTLEPIGEDSDFTAYVHSDGNVTLAVGGLMYAKCSTADVSKFPFDSQTCALQFAVWGYLETEVILKEADNPISYSFFTPNSNWDFQSATSRAYVQSGYSIIDIYITVQRESLYYTLMTVLPTCLFSLMNPLVFLLPVESGERIGLAMTILLSYAIFLTLVSAAIPASSNPMCILIVFMIITIVLSGCIVVLAIFISVIYTRENYKEINKFWKFFATRLPWSRFVKITAIKTLSAETGASNNWVKNQEITWKDVCNGLDIFCMVVSYIIVTLLTIIFFGVVA